MKIAFIHPDLGIGGAERLVVDAAVGLQNQGHDVVIYTSHCDKSHCFEEVKDGTLKVIVSGNSVVPAKFLNRFAIICAILRQLHLTYNLIQSAIYYDVFIIDQLSACIPFLRLYTEGRILFYGHFPDQALAKRTSLVKKLYRIPFDWIEQWSTNYSDVIVVNSKFTRSVFKKMMRLDRVPEVVYPCVDIKASTAVQSSQIIAKKLSAYKVLMSINRFERTKKVDLAVDAFALIGNDYKDALLVVAGGYDKRVAENVEYMRELQQTCEKAGLPYITVNSLQDEHELEIPSGTKVVFLPSVSTGVKNAILQQSKVLLYTPENEHFGIVPLEGMLAKVPVLATNTGGPLETIVDGETGWNRQQDQQVWAQVIKQVLDNKVDTASMGQAGYERVVSEFSTDKMAKQFDAAVDQSRHVQRQSIAQFRQVIRSAKSLLFFIVLMVFVKRFWL